MVPEKISINTIKNPWPLYVLGLGPHAENLLTLQANHLLHACNCVVGYAGYNKRIKAAFSDKDYFDFSLGEEQKRAQFALDLAAKPGKKVVLISGGDPGIYAMAAVVFELLKQLPSQVKVEVVPGISAFQALAAKAGAPVGHDFCLISFSDLLTPFTVIMKRLKHALLGDFVICVYNPASNSRKALIQEAWLMMRAHRADDTPVIVGESVGHESERIVFTTLKDCDVGSIHMHQMLIIGSSSTQHIQSSAQNFVFTPRGYKA